MQVATICSHKPPPVLTDWHVKLTAHSSQELPLFPHWVAVPPVWQKPLMSQQPEQFCGPHVDPIWQLPAWQVEPGPQTEQNCPTWPHPDGCVPIWQVPVKSQQPVQFWGPQLLPVVMHEPAAQNAFGGQTLQVLPLTPHAACVSPFWQIPF